LKEVVLRIFIVHRSRPGVNPRTLGHLRRMLTTRLPRLYVGYPFSQV
jgi:predicted small integral membrane protein